MFSIDSVPETKEGFEVLPAGIYRVRFTGVQFLDNKSGQGQHFAFSLQVVQPQMYAGQTMIYRCNYKNPNPTAEEIGRGQLADLIFTAGVRGFENLEQLNRGIAGKEFIIETELQEGDRGGLFSNVLTAWRLDGKHRNEKRSLKEVKIGETGRPPKPPKASKAPQPSRSTPSFGAPMGGYNGPSNVTPLHQQPSMPGMRGSDDDVPF